MLIDKKEQEERDQERKKRVAERMRRMVELEREQEAQKKLISDRLKQKLERKQKMRRTGGGFSVPYNISKDEIEDMQLQKKVQNYITESDDEETKSLD